MKLGELRSHIRGHKGTVFVETTLGGELVRIPVQKTLFMKESLEAFGEHKNAESGLTFGHDGVVRPEPNEWDEDPSVKDVSPEDEAVPAAGDDEDDLMGHVGSNDEDDTLLGATEEAPTASDDDGFDDLLG